MLVSRLIAAKPPLPSASQTPEIRFVRYQNRYLGWTACHELLKHIPHALAHLIAAKPCRCPAFDRSWEGLYAIKRAGFGLCAGSGRQVGWKPQWLRSYRVFCRECKHANWPEIPRFCRLQPTRNLAAYLIAYKPRPGGQETRLGEGFVRYQMCGFLGCVWAHHGPV